MSIGRPRSTAPVPSDFARYAGCEGDLRLRARYGVGRSVVLRWRAETGIYCGTPRGKRGASRPSYTKPAPHRVKKRYTPAAMDEISWYDGEDDVAGIIGGLDRWRD